MNGDQALSSVFREQEQGEPQLIAQGYEYEVPLRVEVDGHLHEWSERRLVVRSLRHAQAAEAALRARVAKAKDPIEGLNLRGRGYVAGLNLLYLWYNSLFINKLRLK